MKKIILLLSLALSLNAYSQKLVKEYYDWAKTKIKKQYYTDAYGTLNGSFKAYSEYGGIMKQGQCKNDGPIGKWIENYDNGKLHYIKYYDTPGTNDFQVQDGKVISYYEDGKTIKYERSFKKLELHGVWKVYDENGVLIEEDIYINGESEKRRKRIESEKIENDLKEKERNEKEKERKEKENAQNYKSYISFAENYLIAKNYNEAKRYFLRASELASDKTYLIDKIREINAVIEEKAQAEVKFDLQVKQIDTLYNEFKNHYVLYKKSIWVDPLTNKQIIRETYPKGEYLYKKSNSIINELLNDYNVVLDAETEIIKGKVIISILEKMIGLANSNTKEIEKQMKKAQSNEEVKMILGL